MDTLDNTKWDVLIVGTGLQQSLLALALSRSDKKILHVDENSYYGGAEAALSLQEAEEWATGMNGDGFVNASVSRPEPVASDPSHPLSSSRAYSLELSPQLLYARSSLLQYLVSSKVHKQLEFLPAGSWWVYSPEPGQTSSASGSLLKVPSARADVFPDNVLDFKAKRAKEFQAVRAMSKFLRFIAEYEERTEDWDAYRDQPFSAFLSSEKFKIPGPVQALLLALTLSPLGSVQTTTAYSLPRVARHLRSIGVFGEGFGAVLPKWGGLSEIVQVGCRSCAVGGGVYVLGKGLSDIAGGDSATVTSQEGITLRLKDGESVTTQWVVEQGTQEPVKGPMCCRSATIVSSPLSPLFPSISEDGPAPASAVVTFPSGSLSSDMEHPVHIFVHSSDTGQCPVGQSILYASTAVDGKHGFAFLSKAVDALLNTVDVTPTPSVLWSLQYEQRPYPLPQSTMGAPDKNILSFPCSSLDLAFDDSTLDRVKQVWQKIVGDDASEFLVFEDREGQMDDDA